MTTTTASRFGNFRLGKLEMMSGWENEAFKTSIKQGAVEVALVSNTGTGGSHEWHWFDKDAEKEFLELAVAASDDNFEVEDSLVWDLIEATKMGRKKTLMYTTDSIGSFWTEGQFYTAKSSLPLDVLREKVLADEPTAKFFDKDVLDFV